MFCKRHTLKQLSVGIAVAASLAVVAVPSALGAHDSWYRNAVSQTASRQSVPFITDTLGGNGNSEQATVRGYRFITDTLGGNGHVATGPSGTSFSWGDAGVGAGIAAGLMLLLLGGTRLRMNNRSVLTA